MTTVLGTITPVPSLPARRLVVRRRMAEITSSQAKVAVSFPRRLPGYVLNLVSSLCFQAWNNLHGRIRPESLDVEYSQYVYRINSPARTVRIGDVRIGDSHRFSLQVPAENGDSHHRLRQKMGTVTGCGLTGCGRMKLGTVTIGSPPSALHRLRIGDSHRCFLFTTRVDVLSQSC